MPEKKPRAIGPPDAAWHKETQFEPVIAQTIPPSAAKDLLWISDENRE